jgi:aspartate-semialdehyde dehydrogenase
VAARPYRIAIVGASSLAGKELGDTLAESSLAASDVVLLDDEEMAGQVTTAGDEVTFIQKIDAVSFAGMDFVFFTGDPAATKKYWKAARLAGASIIDMTYALETEPGALVRGPWVHLAGAETSPGESGPHAQGPDLSTPAVVSAHPAALMLLLVASRIQAKLPLHAISATLFEPASEHGRLAMDELHRQTVALLSFQTLPRDQYDAQVAFNILPSLGEAAKVSLAATEARVLAQYAALSIASGPAVSAPEPALQLAQAPVFHGYVASVLVELERPATATQMDDALRCEPIDVVGADYDPPSNISAAGQPDVLVSVRSAIASDGASTRFWLWLAADNLKLSALNAIACANELRRLRPQGKVQ